MKLDRFWLRFSACDLLAGRSGREIEQEWEWTERYPDRPDDWSHAARGERSREILQRDPAAIAHRQIFDLHRRFLALLMRALRSVRIVAGSEASDERCAAKAAESGSG